MTVFIAHASQDKDAAEALAEKLRQRAFLVELENGEGAMRPLSTSDALIGLISKDFVFSPYKLRLEKRLLDAWADGQLVQVKLDHAFAPVGLRDLPAIDASFEAQRDFTWMKVADAVRALQAQTPQAPAAIAPPMAERPPSPAPVEWREQKTSDTDGGDYDHAPPMAHKRIAAKSGFGFWGWLFTLLLLSGAGAGYYAITKGELQAPPASTPSDQPANPTPPPDYTPPAEIAGIHLSQPILMATAIVVGLLIMAMIAIRASQKAALERRMGKPSKSRKEFEAGAAAAEAPKPGEPSPSAPRHTTAKQTEEPKAVAVEPLVFISYARADQASVDPLAQAVKDSGHPIWIDKDAINAGTSWAGEIVRAIKSAGHVLIMCSPRSFESDQVKREVYLADRYKKPLMPVFLEAAEPPEDFEYFFAGVQWLRLHEAPEADRPAILARALPAA